MPNWCHNKLEVRGAEPALRFFQEAVSTDKGSLSFAATCPEPVSSKEHDWYSWRVESWGTKWDLSEGECSASSKIEGEGFDAFCLYSFATAWSPPTEWLRATAALFPELEFSLRYAEVGNDFAGIYTVSGRDVLEDKEMKPGDILEKEEMWF